MTTRGLESLACPRCRSTALRADGAVLGCWRCGGVFLRGAVADSVRRALDPRAQAAAERTVGSPFARVDLASPASCPVCRATMTRFPAGPVDVDTCASHGTWYDPGELRAVRDALVASGARTEPAPAAPTTPAVPQARPPPPHAASLELAEVPRAQRRAARRDDVSFDFKAEQARERAERDRAQASEEPMIDVLGAVLGAVGISMVSAALPSSRRRHRRHGRQPGGGLVGVIERAIFE